MSEEGATAPNIAQVLLVEDSPSIAEIYLGYLRWEPYQVTHVGTGVEALAVLEKALPHAMLLDLNLPDMNGMEILREVVQRGLPTSVVIITAHGTVDVAVEAMRSGAFDFLVKPFKADRLLVTLRNALEKQRPLSRLPTVTMQMACPGIQGCRYLRALYRLRSTPITVAEELTGKMPAVKVARTIGTLRQLEYEVVEEAIALCGGSISKAAALLDVSVSTVYRKRKLGMRAD